MNTETPNRIRKHDDGAIATTKLLLIGSMILLTVAAIALAFLWYSASTKDAKLEREKEEIKLERQLAKDSERQQTAVTMNMPANLPTIDLEPIVTQHDKPDLKPHRSQVNEPMENVQQSPQNKNASDKTHYKGWKKYLGVTTDDYSLSFLIGQIEGSLLR